MTCHRIGQLVVTLAAASAALVAAPRPAHAHVAPSATENNRYLKLTLLADRVRLSYTVFFGDRPGAGERQRMDQDGSGLLDDAETRSFGAALRDDVAGHVRLVVDGVAVAPSTWTVEDVGLGTPQTTAGAFAVDLLLYVPTHGAGAHSLTLADTWMAPDPGETEMRVEESPGVRLATAHLERQPGENQVRWTFRGNPADDRALRIEWTVDDAAFSEAAAASDEPPAGARPAALPHPRRVLWIALALTGLGTLALAWLVLRKTAGGRATGTGRGT